MADWKNLVRSRLAPLGMTAPAESALADELAQHLEDQYRELRSGGASDEQAYRKTIAELDDMYPLRASSIPCPFTRRMSWRRSRRSTQ